MREALKTSTSKYGQKANSAISIENVVGKGLQLVVRYAGKKHYTSLSRLPLNPDDHKNPPHVKTVSFAREGNMGVGTSATQALSSSSTEGRLTISSENVKGDPGKSLFIDHDVATATAGTYTASHIDVDRTGGVSSGSDTTVGLDIDVNATGASGGTIIARGASIGVVGDSGGDSTATALDCIAAGADNNYAATLRGTVGIGTSTPDGQLTVSGSEGNDGIINLWSDDGDDNGDKWRLRTDGSSFYIENYSTASWVSTFVVDISGRTSGTVIKDEDDMASDSATAIVTQQSIKAYVDSKTGWHGSTTRVKILHSDFTPDDGGRPYMIDDTGVASENLFGETHGTAKAYATVVIPTGYKATVVMVYGTSTPAVEVWEHQINSKTGVSKGTGNVDTEINITDVDSSATNYLFIQVNQGSGDEIHGGYVTIAPI